jgi:hypothetical protein
MNAFIYFGALVLVYGLLYGGVSDLRPFLESHRTLIAGFMFGVWVLIRSKGKENESPRG